MVYKMSKIIRKSLWSMLMLQMFCSTNSKNSKMLNLNQRKAPNLFVVKTGPSELLVFSHISLITH